MRGAFSYPIDSIHEYELLVLYCTRFEKLKDPAALIWKVVYLGMEFGLLWTGLVLNEVILFVGSPHPYGRS